MPFTCIKDRIRRRAEYIRNGLNFDYMKNNVELFLNSTVNTSVTFINTFNVFSLVGVKDYLEFILELRKKYSRHNQGVKYIPIYDPYNTHPDYVVNPNQRIWFDVPLLHNPKWQSITVLPNSFSKYFEEALDFMKSNTDTSNFVGFYNYEIEKVQRNYDYFLDAKKDNISLKNFANFFKQYDQRNRKSLAKVYPELVSIMEK